MGLVAPRHVGSSRTSVPCIARHCKVNNILTTGPPGKPSHMLFYSTCYVVLVEEYEKKKIQTFPDEKLEKGALWN